MIRNTLTIALGSDALSLKSARAVAAEKPAFFTVPRIIMQLESVRSTFSFLVINSYNKPNPMTVIKKIKDILPSRPYPLRIIQAQRSI
ncbi:MAG: hypothetical protein GH148_03295 [Clostridia bacterium]|nr:hypothetical protein [Clostridia bacterium]